MNLSPAILDASYAACRRLSRQAGSNFPAAFFLLPHGKRRAMHALYAFMRHSDDLVDSPHPDRLPEEALNHWRAALEHALLGCFEGPASATAVSAARRATAVPAVPGRARKGTAETAVARGATPLQGDVGLTLLPAVADTVHQFKIPPEHLRAVLDGMEMDLTQRRYQTFDQLQTYCERVASAVGRACIHIWGFDGPAAFEPARCAGIALQLTNILRDLREDLETDHVYLPLDDLRECGYSVEELRDGVMSAAFHRLMELEIDRAEGFYRRAADLLRWLHPDGRRIFGLMMATYRSLLAEIRERPGDVFARRIGLSWPRKLRIAARWALLTPSAAALA
jgi:15-cis-phytoene synthase